MKIDILTLFPEMFKGPFDESIIKRAQDKSLVEINIHNLRKWAKDKRGTVDDRPYGGGIGMVMMVEPIVDALEAINIKDQRSNIKTKPQNLKTKILLLSPRGKVWKQEMAQEYSKLDNLILICGHYEGVDERVREFIDEEISIGDFVLTGGELPAMIMVDSIVRLLPNVLLKPEATELESFSPISNIKYQKTCSAEFLRNTKTQSKNQKLLLEYPQYTHPEDFRGLKVPPILLSGNHKEIEKWRRGKALEITKRNRPDLLKNGRFEAV